MIHAHENAGPELPYLEVFRAVCQEGGFTAAARRLGCTQPAVSYQIRKLEEVVGLELVERDGRRLVLTPAGRRFRALADDVFAELARVRSACVVGRRLEPLRLGSVSGFGRYVVLPALRRLRDEEGGEGPEVRLQYEAADVLLDRLEDGAYEGAFVYKRKVTSGVSFRRVYDEELVLVASPDRAAELRAGRPDRLETLEAVPFVTYEECDYVFGRWFDTTFGAQPSRIVSRSHFTELEEVLDFVAASVGFSVVPRDSAETLCASGAIDILYAGSGAACFNRVFLATRPGSDVRPLLQRLVDLLDGGSGPD